MYRAPRLTLEIYHYGGLATFAFLEKQQQKPAFRLANSKVDAEVAREVTPTTDSAEVRRQGAGIREGWAAGTAC